MSNKLFLITAMRPLTFTQDIACSCNLFLVMTAAFFEIMNWSDLIFEMSHFSHNNVQMEKKNHPSTFQKQSFMMHLCWEHSVVVLCSVLIFVCHGKNTTVSLIAFRKLFAEDPLGLRWEKSNVTKKLFCEEGAKTASKETSALDG